MESLIISKIIDKVKSQKRKIVLPEAQDLRVLKATENIAKLDFCDVVLIGNKEEIEKIASSNNIDISKSQIVDPLTSEKYEIYVNEFYELRKNKGISMENAREIMKDNMYFATMMVKLKDADGVVSGAVHSSADTLRPALQIIKAKEGIKTVSSFFLMETKNKDLGENGVFIFSDCGLVEFPTVDQLVDISILSAKSFKELVGSDAKVALLSYSTKGSAKSEMIDKVVAVKNELDKLNVDFKYDGELQLDAAIIPEVAKMKVGMSPVAGKANVLIFPDLQAGNIGYKLVQRFGDAIAIGPLTQGLNHPVNDLSRGCSIDDIVGAVAITCAQC